MIESAERRLWQAVLLQAFHDAAYTGSGQRLLEERRKARAWITAAGPSFRLVCTLADVDPHFLSRVCNTKRGHTVYLRAAQLLDDQHSN